MAKTTDRPLWVWYTIEWQFLTRLCGSVPAAPELVMRWLEARKPVTRPQDARSISDIALRFGLTARCAERCCALEWRRVLQCSGQACAGVECCSGLGVGWVGLPWRRVMLRRALERAGLPSSSGKRCLACRRVLECWALACRREMHGVGLA